MTVQTVPYALQNASHSAALFRQSASSPWFSPGVIQTGELAVSAQVSPNMTVRLNAGRAKVEGTSVSSPTLATTGLAANFSTQAMYDVLNDATLSLTVTASNPTNPRIDAVYVQVQDSFYSGATNTAVAGIVAGVPAASPVAPAVPANAQLIAYIAVAANATSIVNGNITNNAPVALLQTGIAAVTSTPVTTFGTNWSNGSGPLALTCYQVGTLVFLNGRITFGASGGAYSNMCTIPAALQPPTSSLRGIGLAVGTTSGITFEVSSTSGVLGQITGTNSGSLPFSISYYLNLQWNLD